MIVTSFEECKARSRVWEDRIGDVMYARGWQTLPVYELDHDDKPPRAFGKSGDLILPDILCMRNASIMWVEVKVKTRSSYYKKGGYRVTGICQRHCSHYEEIQVISGGEVVIAFVHEEEGEVISATLNNLLDAHLSHTCAPEKTGGMGKHGMVFFRYDSIGLWFKIDENLNKDKEIV